jgi:mycothiol synthase
MDETVEAVARIENAARAVDGHPSLGEAVWRDLESPAPDSAGFFAAGRAYVHVARSDNFSPQHWAVGVVVHPDARDRDDRIALLGEAARHVAAHGGGRMVLWVFGATGADDAELARAGLRPTRGLHEMRVPLPLSEAAKWPDGVTVRTFQPDRDEGEWLEVNNRAFRNHPEQGGWVAATLARRMAEPWFDPSLFFLAFDDKGLVGFDWLKIHDAHGRDPQLGEIFVIGVDPRAHGTGLGRALAVVGLDAVAARGITTGSLFVAADNEPALRLYRSLGFTEHRTDRAYEREVTPA